MLTPEHDRCGCDGGKRKKCFKFSEEIPVGNTRLRSDRAEFFGPVLL